LQRRRNWAQEAAFATSAFFLLTAMVLLDVLAGFIVTIVASRRDIEFGGN